jgi:hypothetical protein
MFALVHEQGCHWSGGVSQVAQGLTVHPTCRHKQTSYMSSPQVPVSTKVLPEVVVGGGFRPA